MRITHSRPVQIRLKLRNFDLTICDLAAMAASLYVPCARAKHSGESSCYRRDTRPLSVFRGIEKWKITPATLSFSFIFSWSSMLGLHSPGDIHLVEKRRTFWKIKRNSYEAMTIERRHAESEFYTVLTFHPFIFLHFACIFSCSYFLPVEYD